MPVYQVTDKLKVKPNCIFVIPAKQKHVIAEWLSALFHAVESRGLRLPVDVFSVHYADDRHEKSIGIILSGMVRTVVLE